VPADHFGTPASDTPRPGSARAGGMGLGVARTTLPLSRNASAHMRCQCITVTANTTMMAALSEPMTANGTIRLRYLIATPAFQICSKGSDGGQFGSAEPQKCFRPRCRNDFATGWGTACQWVSKYPVGGLYWFSVAERFASTTPCGLLPSVGTIIGSDL
jgi:hypothetical protein